MLYQEYSIRPILLYNIENVLPEKDGALATVQLKKITVCVGIESWIYAWGSAVPEILPPKSSNRLSSSPLLFFDASTATRSELGALRMAPLHVCKN